MRKPKHTRCALCSALLAGVMGLGACSDGDTTDDAGPRLDAPVSVDGSDAATPAAALRVMTVNLYLGADVTELLVDDPLDVPAAVNQLYKAMEASKPAERMEAVAAAIDRTAPHVVAIQEATLLREQIPSDYINGNPEAAEDVVYDFLKLLQDALAARDLDYTVAIKQDNADVELPRQADDLQWSDVRLTDRDVILVRNDVATDAAAGHHFVNNLEFGDIAILRGWVQVVATIQDIPYVIVNTHLESGGPAVVPLRVAQAQELLDAFRGGTAPMVLTGDFNSPAVTGPAYAMILEGGYIDAWLVAAPAVTGNTCCQAADLQGDTQLSRRIDIVFTRNIPWRIEAAQTALDTQAERTPSGLWPSDHAAVQVGFGP